MEEKIEATEVELTEQEVNLQRITGIGRLVFPLAFVVLVALVATDVLDAGKLEAAVASVLAVAGLVLAWWKDNNMTIMAIVRHMVWREAEEGEDD